MSSPRKTVAGAWLCALLAIGGCSQPAEPSQAVSRASSSRPLARLEPARGVEFGISLDWEHDSTAAVAERLGRAPSVYVAFAHLPIAPTVEPALARYIEEVQAQHGVALLTLEPTAALDQITSEMAEELADRLAQYNARGIPVLVRFAHEMNGSWYPWGQQPSSYRTAFRRIADAVHARASETAMLWAPNYGAGYPFAAGSYAARPGSDDFAALDTNHDGVLDGRDDMYAPYYPGDEAVDWVGMTLYHWGDTWPWGKNIVPEPGKFVAQLTGTYHGAGGDQRGLPNFYAIYAEEHAKPMAIPETAAFYNTSVDGDTELEIKRAWWRQVFGPEVAQRLPAIKMINWFEWRKAEPEVNDAVVDWSITLDPTIRDAFKAELNWDAFLVAAGPASQTDGSRPTPSQTQTPGTGGGERRLQFAGYTWRVRNAAELEGPGPNYFSDRPEHVWLDDRGRLHLRAAPGADGRWYCAEVALEASLGYGTYRFKLDGSPAGLDPSVVLGLFTWSDNPDENHRELDIEFGRFGDPAAAPARYTVQPYTEAGNVWEFVPTPASESTHTFEWRPDSVTFLSRPGPAQHTFGQRIPHAADEQVHLNLWLDAGRAPTDARAAEMIVRDFSFTPGGGEVGSAY